MKTEYCQYVNTEQYRCQFLVVVHDFGLDGGVECPAALELREHHRGGRADVSCRCWDGECRHGWRYEGGRYGCEGEQLARLVCVLLASGEVEVEAEGEAGGQLVQRPGQGQPLTVDRHQAEDARHGEGGVECDLVAGGHDVPVLAVEEEAAETGQAAEEDVTHTGVEDERPGVRPPPGPLSEEQPGEPADRQQTEEGPL